jgi:hypothetical protein
LLDGREPTDIKPGVPTDAAITLRLSAADVGRYVACSMQIENCRPRLACNGEQDCGH